MRGYGKYKVIETPSQDREGQCLNCMDEQEYDLTVPANRKDLINVIEAVKPKTETLSN